MNSSKVLRGAIVLQAFKSAGIEFVVALPDIVTCDGVLWPISRDADFQLVMVCKEDEGVSICSGLSYTDKRAVLLIQHTGFLDSINAIRAMGMDYQLPVVMAIGLQGMESDRTPPESDHNGIRILEPILNAMAINYMVVDEYADPDRMAQEIDSAYRTPNPFAFLISRVPA